MKLTIQEELLMPFPVSRIHWRVGATNQAKTSGIALAYIDARDVMQRLDEIFGLGGWQCRYNLADNGLLICEIGIKLGDEWIWRANGAGDTQVEAEKGKASDAFKRAGVMFGIARYLYSLPNEWVNIQAAGRSYKLSQRPSLPTWATPEGYREIIMRRRAEATFAEAEPLEGDPIQELTERMKLKELD